MMNLAFLASNNGSSFRAILEAIERGELAARARLLVSNRRTSAALAFAESRGIEALFLPTLSDPDDADARLAEALTRAQADIVVLSGYLRRLGPVTLERFGGRILNIHPALLPRHGGQGMYGRRVHEAVLAAGEAESGASVHLVDRDYDHGPVIAQAKAPVAADDTPESLEARVMAMEPGLFIATLARIAAGEFPDIYRGARP